MSGNLVVGAALQDNKSLASGLGATIAHISGSDCTTLTATTGTLSNISDNNITTHVYRYRSAPAGEGSCLMWYGISYSTP